MRFDEQGDGLGRYDIYNFRKVQGSSPNTTAYAYKTVGHWFDAGLSLDEDTVLWNERSTSVPESVCSFPCKLGEIKIMQAGDTCCWICNPCKDQEFVLDEFHCQKCDDGWWPTPNKTGCVQLPEQVICLTAIPAISVIK